MDELDPDEILRRLNGRERQLDIRAEEIAKREAQLIDNITMQAIAVVLLRSLRKNGKLKPSDRTEIGYAAARFANDDFHPRKMLTRILSETDLDREERRVRPE